MATTTSRTKKSRARWTPNRRTTSGQSAAASRPTSRARPRAAAAGANADDTVLVANVSASTSSSSNGSTGRAVVASTVNANAARPPRVSARLTRGFSPPPSMVGARPSNLSRFEPKQARTNSPQFGPFYVGWQDGQGDLSLSNSWCCSAVKLAHARITASRRGAQASPELKECTTFDDIAVAPKASFHRYSSSSASSTLSDRDEPFSSRSDSPFSSSTSMSSSCTCSEDACLCSSDDYYSSIPGFSGTPRIASSSTSSTSIENSTSQSLIVVPLTPSMPLLERTERIWDGHMLPSHVLLPSAGTFKLDSNSPDETELKLVKFEIEEGSQSLLEGGASGEPIAPTMSHWLNEDAWE
ncbi:BZ3500_MvSof-1268-A1-R1_Chr10-1g02577 [Microbotryum saponariae]|uniref:BZ3500_MvSof-1268-A1-R1_Chr10-1g02577 protein n=1 Tax=Microbotryum saponariae TaxID=289078 RepID=A0A2X0N7Y6_9BASI|nr:BZ3500_MvSof-1268-A1-R1_Chr10-1g02577 [Microbotryum saponariae]SDA06066.1 BZ3501_MvSof-1269-A2-R1_Chr10-1g02178 [Microbotryum saponariae]